MANKKRQRKSKISSKYITRIIMTVGSLWFQIHTVMFKLENLATVEIALIEKQEIRRYHLFHQLHVDTASFCST